ncbi:MAG: sulfite exporter TauE/SafE family protein [Clostridia bacterium]|nr:sulfite exporter TauE/SafE family protein [Clostridia bacterium]
MEKTLFNRRMQGILCGVLVGLANSLFGGGGGMIAVPLLKGLGLSEKEAHATAILVILPVSVLSFALYAFRGYFDGQVAIPAAVGVFFGGMLGAKTLQKVSNKWIAVIFALLQAMAGAWLLLTR